MPDADPRRLLVDGVSAATLMQVATIGDGGFPAICQVWFQPTFEPDRLCFVSRADREHSINIRNDPRVAASIALEVPAGLGGQVRGITLTGLAREVPDAVLPEATAAFIARWPRAAAALGSPTMLDTAGMPARPNARSPAGPTASPAARSGGSGGPGGPGGSGGPGGTAWSVAPPVPRPGGPSLTPRSRLYEIAVIGWVLFDEVNFPTNPRRIVPAH